VSRQPIVIDTNVLIAANESHPESLPIAAKCAKRLKVAESNEIICLDDARMILTEYGRHLPKGRRGAGDMFYLWLVQRLANPSYCRQVPLSRVPDSDNEFSEFPALPVDLARLIDPSDRKFIAVANAHPQKPPIVQATDSKWIGWEAGLAAVGIRIEFIDPVFLRPTYEKKMGTPE
jgi:hypothetical protein